MIAKDFPYLCTKDEEDWRKRRKSASAKYTLSQVGLGFCVVAMHGAVVTIGSWRWKKQWSGSDDSERWAICVQRMRRIEESEEREVARPKSASANCLPLLPVKAAPSIVVSPSSLSSQIFVFLAFYSSLMCLCSCWCWWFLFLFFFKKKKKMDWSIWSSPLGRKYLESEPEQERKTRSLPLSRFAFRENLVLV